MKFYVSPETQNNHKIYFVHLIFIAIIHETLYEEDISLMYFLSIHGS